jgi:hypothetical protein
LNSEDGDIKGEVGGMEGKRWENQVLITDYWGRLCGLVVRVPGYRSGGLGSILGATRFSEK